MYVLRSDRQSSTKHPLLKITTETLNSSKIRPLTCCNQSIL